MATANYLRWSVPTVKAALAAKGTIVSPSIMLWTLIACSILEKEDLYFTGMDNYAMKNKVFVRII